jgi:hypothetical protein
MRRKLIIPIRKNELVRDAKGKPQYSAVVSFSHGGRRLWSEQIVLALRRQNPELLPLDDEAQHEADEAARWFGRGAA